MNGIFEQAGGISLKRMAPSGSLTRKLGLDFRPDVNGDGHALPRSQAFSFSLHPTGFVFLSQDHSPLCPRTYASTAFNKRYDWLSGSADDSDFVGEPKLSRSGKHAVGPNRSCETPSAEAT